ncbi:terpene synthase family protein [Kitasatospora viridis]|uniref:Terpene synthase n=1 Tax=Kitasatospora viridis TaxID=281105 RepID=A0A561TVX9_9ACTN|nr:hypothetical protein [Kitasatospora viridis]TWF91265.1 hypothetical protein FHX73_12377 [Kitasatospora viridis]
MPMSIKGEVTDPRLADLDSSIRNWLTSNRLVLNVDAFLGHGYLALCLRAWPDSTGARLDLAVRWAIWTWAADDILDSALLDSDQAREFAADVGRAISGGGLTGAIHPAVAALVPLAMETRSLMPVEWWRKYQHEMSAWLSSATDRLARYVLPRRVPSLRAYQAIRPDDGGMLLAAAWCELATGCVTDVLDDPLVRVLLMTFSTVGYLANDLVADEGDVFTVVRALARTEGLSAEEAHGRAVALLAAELERWQYLCGVVQDDGEDGYTPPRLAMSPMGLETVVDTRRVARIFDQFLRALVEWTATSTRYASVPAAAEAGA